MFKCKTYAFVLKQQLEKPESEEITPDSQRGEDSAVAESKESRDLRSYISLPRGDLGQATKHLSVLVSSSVQR